VLLVGLTGGIGAGKSTVARMLADRGAVVIDADDLARAALDPGSPGAGRVREEFGPRAVSADGTVDREWLARRVFDDPDARRRLEAIVHPEVGRLFREATERYRDSGRVVVYDVPLLVESGLEGMFDLVVVVEAPVEVRLARLAERGVGEDDARRRIATQASDADRAAVADVILRNDGDTENLTGQVDDLWGDVARRVGTIDSP
jgi:dephospho-CoA kinase